MPFRHDEAWNCESVGKVRALARGEFGELHVGYSPSPTTEILSPALVEFRKASPGVKVILHDLAGDELCAGLGEGSLELAVTVRHPREEGLGITFEELLSYRICAAVHPGHRFAGLKSISVKKAAADGKTNFQIGTLLVNRIAYGIVLFVVITIACILDWLHW
jgi:DNA-binding transcriptional LysR family regulator